ncbi:unnamed protein product [Blepharisma stoltei]|uniref:Enamelin n=1 Tax=Blepharisma stoltei TaxID=1481888 RepID=A0AAU9K0J2_9CILI|nr:unnamed protein product [Blepharisma stoltei]
MYGSSYQGSGVRQDIQALNLYADSARQRENQQRSLRTDDIQGAQAKTSFMKRANYENSGSGLNLPSYAGQEVPPAGSRKGSGYRAKAPFATFEDEPVQVKNQINEGGLEEIRGENLNQGANFEADQRIIEMPKNIAANFYGVTPPQSSGVYQIPYQSQSPYQNQPSYQPALQNNRPVSNEQVYSKDTAKFYGVTPPQSGYPSNFPNEQANFQAPEQINDPFNDKDLAKFYGITPPQSGNRANLFMQNPDNLPQSRGPIKPNYDIRNPELNSQSRGSNKPVYDAAYNKDAARFYGITPPQTGSQANAYPNYNQDVYFQNQPPSQGRQQVQLLSQGRQQAQLPSQGNQQTYTNPVDEGTDPMPENQIQYFNQDSGYDKNAARFYGITPPPTGGRRSETYLENNQYQIESNQYAPPMSGGGRRSLNAYEPEANPYVQSVEQRSMSAHKLEPRAISRNSQLQASSNNQYYGNENPMPYIDSQKRNPEPFYGNPQGYNEVYNENLPQVPSGEKPIDPEFQYAAEKIASGRRSTPAQRADFQPPMNQYSNHPSSRASSKKMLY